MRKRVVVFDLDDTLYKEIDFLKSAYMEIASWIEESYGKIGVYEYMLSCYKQKLNVFSCVNDEYELDIPLRTYLMKYREHLPTIFLSDNVESTLKRMYKANIISGIITDGRRITQSNKIRALKLDRYILWENCIISETLGYSKPSLEAFLYFQHKYGSADYYYIGDNVLKDFIAPNQLGWTTICLLDDGQNIHKQLSVSDNMKPQYEIVDFHSLEKLIL